MGSSRPERQSRFCFASPSGHSVFSGYTDPRYLDYSCYELGRNRRHTTNLVVVVALIIVDVCASAVAVDCSIIGCTCATIFASCVLSVVVVIVVCGNQSATDASSVFVVVAACFVVVIIVGVDTAPDAVGCARSIGDATIVTSACAAIVVCRAGLISDVIVVVAACVVVIIGFCSAGLIFASAVGIVAACAGCVIVVVSVRSA